MKKIYKLLAILFIGYSSYGCSDFLDRESESIFTDEQVYSDENMIKSILSNYYSRVNWGQSFDNEGDQYGILDEAGFSTGEPDKKIGFADNLWRVYDYMLIRDINLFLAGLRTHSVKEKDLNQDLVKKWDAEARFLRAWTYFNMVRALGGVPIVYDEVFKYTPGIDITTMQYPRATEAETYDYIINECTEISALLSKNSAENTHGASANKWVAMALKARAAIYAGSLAKYNNLVTPQIKTLNGEVGIPADKADAYYQIAYIAADSIITSGYYALYEKESNKSRNFYLAMTSKKDNPELIWTLDYQYPYKTNSFTMRSLPTVLSTSGTANRVVPLLNLVEAFEYLDNRDGRLKTTAASGGYIYYDKLGDIFKNKDPRLHGTVICPGDAFRGSIITYQAGQKYYQRGDWRTRIAAPGTKDDDGDYITDINGPANTSAWFDNKSGFNFAKFIDESEEAADPARGSEIAFIRFRLAELFLIASEAKLELGDETKALYYLNKIRTRAGLGKLTAMTLDDIMQERRVELALENHRWWDLKRWRKAHIIWDGAESNPNAAQYVLFPYWIKSPGRPENNKWVFDKQKSYMTQNLRYFRLQNYYNFFDQGWLNNNPKLVKNPFQ